MESSGIVTITKELVLPVEGYHVIVVEDIIDTGNTLYCIKPYLESEGAKSIKICALFDKPSRREKKISADYVGFQIENEFIVGYGLDFDEEYRNLPYVGILKPEMYS
jgi:hypoxanthine phosphoribosyltransferase